MNHLFEWLTGIRPSAASPDRAEMADADTRLAAVSRPCRSLAALASIAAYVEGDWEVHVYDGIDVDASKFGFIAVMRSFDREDVLQFTDRAADPWEAEEYPDYVDAAKRMIRGRTIE